MIRSKRPQLTTNEEGMYELMEVLTKPKSPAREPRLLAFINTDWTEDFFAQIYIPPPNADVEELTLNDYQI